MMMIEQRARILVVDDEPDVRETVGEELQVAGHHVVAVESGAAALEAMEADPPDLVLTDVHMPGMTGVELTRRIKGERRWQLVPVVILTAVSDLDARVAGLEAGADDFFAKPVEFVELRTRVRALLQVKRLLDELERAEDLIRTLALTIESRDPYTAGHCERLGRYAAALGRALGVGEDLVRALRLAGYLHDLGKIVVPDGILLKPGRLDAPERLKIQEHPAVGADLVRGLHALDDVRPIIRHHHERWDGSGYPEGLRGESIPLGARIMAVVDVYDALHTARPYKTALPHEQALGILLRETGAGYWDPRVTGALVDVLSELRSNKGNGYGRR